MNHQRVALVFVLSAVTPLLIVALAAVPGTASWIWEMLMLLGYVAAGGLALLPVATAPWSRTLYRSSRMVQATYRWHEVIAYALIALTCVHALGAVIAQPTVVEYLKLSAPLYMLAGLVSGVMLLLLLAQSRRLRTRPINHQRWRWSHSALSLVALGLLGYHVVVSGYYVRGVMGVTALMAIGCAPTLASIAFSPERLSQRQPHRASSPSDGNPRTAIGMTIAVAFWVGLAFAMTWLRVPNTT